MGDSLKAYGEFQQDYTRLCEKYGEKPRENGVVEHKTALALREKGEQEATQQRLKRVLRKYQGVSCVGGLATVGKLLVFARTNNLGRHLKKVAPKEFEGIPVIVVGPYQRPIR